MEMKNALPVAIIGASPVGLAAAAHVDRRMIVVVLGILFLEHHQTILW